MKAITSLLFVLLLATSSCNDLWDNDVVFDENIEITGLSATSSYYGYDPNAKWSAYEYWDYYSQLSASNFVINLQFKSDNTYATKYGIAPYYNGALSTLTITSLSKISALIDSAAVLNHYFLVSKGEYSENLYMPIDTFITQKLDFSKIDLVFSYNRFSDTIQFFDHSKNPCLLEVAITFKDQKAYRDTVQITLIK